MTTTEEIERAVDSGNVDSVVRACRSCSARTHGTHDVDALHERIALAWLYAIKTQAHGVVFGLWDGGSFSPRNFDAARGLIHAVHFNNVKAFLAIATRRPLERLPLKDAMRVARRMLRPYMANYMYRIAGSFKYHPGYRNNGAWAGVDTKVFYP